jgi:hypothetical protein
MHEKRIHFASAFVTLTYEDKWLPASGSLCKRELQLFMKRLRKQRGSGLRFFGCGEYGEQTHRPHYHLLLFNTDFPDGKQIGESVDGSLLYRSNELSALWPLGNNVIGDVTFRSAAYVAGYVVKKLGAPKLPSTLEPEFIVMSRRPGIGAGWFDRYSGEAYRHDSAIMDAKEVPLPRFYDTKFEAVDKRRLEKLKRLRRIKARAFAADNTSARRRVRERFEVLKAARFSRDSQ